MDDFNITRVTNNKSVIYVQKVMSERGQDRASREAKVESDRWLLCTLKRNLNQKKSVARDYNSSEGSILRKTTISLILSWLVVWGDACGSGAWL